MITITFNDNNQSAYLFDDEHNLTSTEDNISCEHFIIGDMNSSNATIHTGVIAPEDWEGGRYLFDGKDWTVNSKWAKMNEESIAIALQEYAVQGEQEGTEFFGWSIKTTGGTNGFT